MSAAGMKTTVVSSLQDVDYSEIKLPLFVIYDHPKDHPEKFVVRLWEGAKGMPTDIACMFDTLDEARAAMPPHFARFERAPSDDPVIVESYF